MRLKILAMIAMMSSLACLAIDLTNMSGRVYSGVTIERVEGKSMIAMGRTGVVKIPLDEMSPDVQKRYNYTPEIPVIIDPAAVKISGKVFQVADDGLIVRGVSLMAEDQKAASQRAVAWALGRRSSSFKGPDGRFYDSGQTIYVFIDKGAFVDGSDFNMMCTPAGTRAYRNTEGSTSTVKAFKAIK
jgi:hypothetical protein